MKVGTKKTIGVIILTLVITAALQTSSFAQPAGGGEAPSGARGFGRRGGRGASVTSPEVAEDGSITFRYSAANAEQVTVSGELDGRSYPMTKDESGVWSVTVGPLPPDIYTYSFNVDGVTSLDPRNANTKYGYGGFGAVSIVQVPGDGPQFYDVKPVPHGVVRIHPYESKSLGVNRTAWIYTPPGYEEGENYPVLYLIHGGGDIESGWTLIGRANNILDNLIAENLAEPMVVVMPLGHTIQSFWTGPAKSAVTAGGGGFGGRGGGGAPQEVGAFGKDLLEDLMPLVEKEYKVSTEADDRAIGGLSMGGGLTMNVGFNRSDLFRYIVIMSSGGQNADVSYPDFFNNADATNEQLKLLWIAVGKDDGLAAGGSKALDELLTSKGINHTYRVTEGRHEWTVWRYHLNEFAQLLFK
ncbi:alpha/beta hydrolase-fold protein [Planctomycetota bacterium]